MRKPRALRSGDRIAIVAPASPFSRPDLQAGIDELRALGFDAVYGDDVFARDRYLAGTPELRAQAWRTAWQDPAVRALIAARGGYGSVQLLPLLDAADTSEQAKAFIGFSDNTSLLTWLNQQCQIVAFHGPMIEARFAMGAAGYDRDTFLRCLCNPEPAGAIVHPQLETLATGEASGILTGGTLTQLVASLGTPFAFSPPFECVLFLDEVNERPYRLDRMLTQLRLAGILSRASAIVFGELPDCNEPGGSTTAKETVATVLQGFPGPILFGLPSGHTKGPCLTLPLGVRARAIGSTHPALVIEEPAVSL